MDDAVRAWCALGGSCRLQGFFLGCEPPAHPQEAIHTPEHVSVFRMCSTLSELVLSRLRCCQRPPTRQSISLYSECAALRLLPLVLTVSTRHLARAAAIAVMDWKGNTTVVVNIQSWLCSVHVQLLQRTCYELKRQLRLCTFGRAILESWRWWTICEKHVRDGPHSSSGEQSDEEYMWDDVHDALRREW